MQFVGVPGIGTRFVAHAIDRCLVERAEITGARRFGGASCVHGLRATLFERRIIEERVGSGVQDLVRQRRGFGRIARDERQLASMNPREDLGKRVEVHRFLEAVAHGLVDQRMIGNRAVAGDVLEARGRVGEDRGHQIVREHALELRRHLLAAAIARHGERDGGVPAPARLEHRRLEERLHEHVAGRRRMQIPEHVGQRKRMLGPQREQQGIFTGCGLQLEIELTAEAFPQRETPRLVHAAAERGVQHELHPAGFVEEPLEHERLLRRNDAERAAGFGEVRNDLLGCGMGDARFVDQPLQGRRAACLEQPIDVCPEIADGARELVAPRGRFAEPERNRRRRAFGVGHADDARPDLEHAPRAVAQLEDVAGGTLDREILVQRPDERLVRVEDHAVVGDFGNGAARRDGEQPCASTAAHAPVDLVAMDERALPPAPGGETLGRHRQHGVEVAAAEVAIGPRAPRQREQLVFAVVAAGHLGDDLLGEHVERCVV